MFHSSLIAPGSVLEIDSVDPRDSAGFARPDLRFAPFGLAAPLLHSARPTERRGSSFAKIRHQQYILGCNEYDTNSFLKQPHRLHLLLF